MSSEACTEAIKKSLDNEPQIALRLVGSKQREQLIVISKVTATGYSLTALNSLGAKRFTYTASASSQFVDAPAFASQKEVRSLVNGLLLVNLYLYQPSSAGCELSHDELARLQLNGRDTGVSKLSSKEQGATFNISDLGYNVALSYMENR